MSYDLAVNPIYERDRDQLLKNSPRAKSDIEAAWRSLCEEPRQADRVAGLGPIDLRKARWPLKSYRIGSSGGLRIVFLIIEARNQILPLTLWQKKDLTNEKDVVALIKLRLKQTTKDRFS